MKLYHIFYTLASEKNESEYTQRIYANSESHATREFTEQFVKFMPKDEVVSITRIIMSTIVMRVK